VLYVIRSYAELKEVTREYIGRIAGRA
jgi:hypothetical protein